MNLRIKKLMKMAIGTSLEVHYGQGQVFFGKITDKDDECIAISNENQEIVIDYDDIELYIDGTGNSNSNVYQSVGNKPSIIPEEKAVMNKSIKPSFEVPIEKIGVSDSMLKSAFSALDSSVKKKLNNRYNSFLYALRTTDWDRAGQNFNALLNDIDEDDDLYYDEEVWAFAAIMSLKCNKENDIILIRGKCFFRAALSAYLTERFSDAGTFACLAVLYDNVEEVKDIAYSIIFNCCVKCNDASAVAMMLKKSDISEHNMELIRVLLANKNKAFAKTSISKSIDDIKNLYNIADMINKVQSLIDENGLEDININNDSTKDTSTNEVSVIKCTGKIVKLTWSKEEGKIVYGDEESETCTFIYESISDASLKNEVKKTLLTNVEDRNWYIAFELSNGEALNIKRKLLIPGKNEKIGTAGFASYEDILDSVLPEDALKKGRYILASRADVERFSDAADLFEIALEYYFKIDDINMNYKSSIRPIPNSTALKPLNWFQGG
jgi:hypothetical protein